MDLANDTALITGSSGGIGEEFISGLVNTAMAVSTRFIPPRLLVPAGTPTSA